MAGSIDVIEPVNANICRILRKTVSDTLEVEVADFILLADTSNGKTYRITIDNGVLTPVEV